MSRLHVALREFGFPSFDFEVLETCPRAELLERERFYIALLDSDSVGNLNIRSNPTATYDGVVSASTRARISAHSKGRKHRPESIEKIRLVNKGRKHTPDQIAKQAASQVGMKRTESACQNISSALTGRKFSEDHRKNISLSRKGMVLSFDHKRKISEGSKGRVFSVLSREKMGVTKIARRAALGASYGDLRKAVVATDFAGNFLLCFESLLDAVNGLGVPNSTLRYYLRTGGKTAAGMLLYYATIVRP